jgi:protein-S-isoprenylcysteine O-methyltransferase Ste14
MNRITGAILAALWIGWLAYWAIQARGAKVTLRRETHVSRALHAGPLLLCGALLGVPRILPAPLHDRFLPDDAIIHGLAVLVTACGLAFAIWARRHLGGNWSGAVVLKADHRLIRSGPYRLVRHPIYTGLFVALLGTVMAIGEWRGLIGLALAAMAIISRVKAEDALMAQAFGAEYEDYRRRTPALLPFIA